MKLIQIPYSQIRVNPSLVEAVYVDKGQVKVSMPQDNLYYVGPVEGKTLEEIARKVVDEINKAQEPLLPAVSPSYAQGMQRVVRERNDLRFMLDQILDAPRGMIGDAYTLPVSVIDAAASYFDKLK